ncbi:conjugal transfer protein [Zunongwangia endophytica]|uniref:Conjugal transfer protein n=1 Tax=Zunongwangia endophytica TaxID=1808945 RepID=A0ABV8HE39_9FLAO|nr:conjugal transfer protein [Zunongwangia endophytica]MDN3594373.1 conjugal transfer protein [Zunongwangia endophytica]
MNLLFENRTDRQDMPIFSSAGRSIYLNTSDFSTRFRSMLVIGIMLLMLLISHNASSQGMPVYDNTNFLSLAKQLIESAKQTSNLLKTVEFLKKQKENIEKVSRVVQQLQAVRELTNSHQRLYETIRTDVRELIDSPYMHPNEARRISDHFEAMIELSLKDLDFIDQVLSSNVFKMSDNDRTQLLQKKEQKSCELLAQVKQQLRQYRNIIAFRELQDIMNTRVPMN